MDVFVDNGSESELMQISFVIEIGLCNSGVNFRMLEDMNGLNEGFFQRFLEVDEVFFLDNFCQFFVFDLIYFLISYDLNSFMFLLEKIEDFIYYLDEVFILLELEKIFEESVNFLDFILSSLCFRIDSSSVKFLNNISVNLELFFQLIVDDFTKVVGDGIIFEVINSIRDGVEFDFFKGSFL